MRTREYVIIPPQLFVKQQLLDHVRGIILGCGFHLTEVPEEKALERGEVKDLQSLFPKGSIPPTHFRRDYRLWILESSDSVAWAAFQNVLKTYIQDSENVYLYQNLERVLQPESPLRTLQELLLVPSSKKSRDFVTYLFDQAQTPVLA